MTCSDCIDPSIIGYPIFTHTVFKCTSRVILSFFQVKQHLVTENILRLATSPGAVILRGQSKGLSLGWCLYICTYTSCVNIYIYVRCMHFKCVYIYNYMYIYICIYGSPPKIYLFEVHNGGCHLLAFICLTV